MGWMNKFGALGPGLLLAAVSVGASHMIMSPTAGAKYEYSLLWLVIFTHLFKYYAFEFGPRFAAAEKMSLLEGYSRVRGPKNWPLYLVVINTVVEGIAVSGAVMMFTAAILFACFGKIFGGNTIAWWGVIIATLIVLLLYTGKYRYLQNVNRFMMAFLAAGTVISFIGAKPSLKIIPALFIPSIPKGSEMLIAAIIGWMPTGVIVSVWHSLWFLEQRSIRKVDDRKRSLKEALLDMRVGYGLSVFLAVMFLTLGATMLHPQGIVPKGNQVADTLSKLFTPIFGEWMYPVFMVVAFFAMFSTSYTVFDGFPRTFAEAWRILRGQEAGGSQKRSLAYWGFIGILYVASIIIIFKFGGKPVKLLMVAGVITFLFSPIYYLLNYYCVTHLIEDPDLKPHPAHRYLAILGIVMMTVSSIFYIYVKHLKS